MSTGSDYSNVIGVFVNRHVVHRRQAVKVRGAGSAQLDLGADVDFASLPALDRDGTRWGSDDRDHAGISQADAFMARRRTRQQLRDWHGLLVFLSRDRSVDVESGK